MNEGRKDRLRDAMKKARNKRAKKQERHGRMFQRPASHPPRTQQEAEAFVLALAARPLAWCDRVGGPLRYPACVFCDGPVVFPPCDEYPDLVFRGVVIPVCRDCACDGWTEDYEEYDDGGGFPTAYLDPHGNVVPDPVPDQAENEDDDEYDARCDAWWEGASGQGWKTPMFLYGRGFAIVCQSDFDEDGAGGTTKVVYAVVPGPPGG
jgi:hypothetical protein